MGGKEAPVRLLRHDVFWRNRPGGSNTREGFERPERREGVLRGTLISPA